VSEDFYAIGKLCELGLGPKIYVASPTVCMGSAVSGFKRSFASDGPPWTY